MEHSYGKDCPVCLDSCDHVTYSRKFERFVRAHAEVYWAQQVDGDPRASQAERDRLDHEYRSLPPGHDCTCNLSACPSYRYGAACLECQRLSRQRAAAVDPPSHLEVGRHGSPAHAPTPLDPMVVDILGRAA